MFHSNLLQVVQGESLHFDNFVVACSIIERITTLWEVIQHTSTIQYWNPWTINPGNTQKVICGWEEREKNTC